MKTSEYSWLFWSDGAGLGSVVLDTNPSGSSISDRIDLGSGLAEMEASVDEGDGVLRSMKEVCLLPWADIAEAFDV